MAVQASNGGYDLDQFLSIVSRMDSAGLLEDFTRQHPEYVVGIEVARAILQRSRTNYNAATRGLGPAPSPPQSNAPDGMAVMASSPANSANSPNVPAKRLGEPQPVNNSGGGFQQSGSQRAISYQQFNPPTIGGGVMSNPQGGGCGGCGGGFPPQQNQQFAGGFPGQGGPPQQPGGFPPQQGLSPCAMANQQGGGGFPPQLSRGQMQMQSQMGMVRPQNSQMGGGGGGSLDQRLASIPEPPPCPFGANMKPHHTVSSFMERPPLEGTLEQRLAAIPQPPLCRRCDEPSSGGAGGGGGSRFCNSGFGGRHVQQADDGLNVKLYPPSAGGFDDGIGGAKIKGFAGQADTDRDVTSMSSRARDGSRTAGIFDGVGGRKVKNLED